MTKEKKTWKQRLTGIRNYLFPAKGDSKGTIVRKIAFLFFCLVFLGSASYLTYYLIDSAQNEAMQDYTIQLYNGEITDEELERINMPDGYLRKFAHLYEQNNDIKGWLTVGGTNIDYPVVQAKDNDYYLRRGFDKKYNWNGSLYLDFRVDVKKPSRNMIIYGHSMRNGQMFRQLLQYADLGFYKQHPVVTFDTVYTESNWKVFAVMLVDTSPERGLSFDFTHTDFNSEQEFMAFVGEVRKRSLTNTAVDVTEGDDLLMLYTCDYTFDGAKMLVVARRVRNGEPKTVDVSDAKRNSNPLMPDQYYLEKGGSYNSGLEPPNSQSAVTSNVPGTPSSQAPSSGSQASSSSRTPSSSGQTETSSQTSSSTSRPPSFQIPSAPLPSSSSQAPSSSSQAPSSSSQAPSSSSQAPSSSSQIETSSEESSSSQTETSSSEQE